MTDHHFLAMDLGAESGRAIAGTLSGGKLGLKEIHRFPTGMLFFNGHYHWNIFRLYEEMVKGLEIYAKAFEGPPESLGVDTWGVDFTLLAKDGSFINLPYAYRDPRTENAMEQFFGLIPREEIYELTGIQFLPFNTLFQLYSMVRDKSPALEIADKLLFIPDIFNYLLSGNISTEFSFATTSQLFNPRGNAWEPELFKKLGISMEIMNDIVQPGTISGELNPQLAERTGLKNVSVTSVASHDTGSAIAAIPAEGKDWAYISSGTWSLMGIESPVPLITDKTLEYNLTNEGGINKTYRFLKNIMGLWLLQECKRVWSARGKEYSYQELTSMAGKAEPFRSLVDPDDQGFINPGDMPAAIRGYCEKTSQKIPREIPETVRCILESLALRYRQVAEQLREISGKPLKKLHIIGGGTHNQLLCQFAADATGMEVITGPSEATAAGNIMAQAMAKGYVSSLDEIRKVIRNSFDMQVYRPENTGPWNKAYEQFMHLIQNSQ